MPGQRPRADRRRPLRRGQHQAGGAVVQRRRVAGRHVPALAEDAGRSAASRSSEVSARGPSSASTTIGSSPRPPAGASIGHDLVVEAAVAARRPPRARGFAARSVLLVAPDAVALGHVLGRLAHRLGRVHRGHARVDQAPAERGVVHGGGPAREPGLGLRNHPRRPAHRLHAARQVEVPLAQAKRARGLVHGLEAGRAEPVHGHARRPPPAAPRGAPPSAPRRGCPRRPGWRRPCRRRRSAPDRRP